MCIEKIFATIEFEVQKYLDFLCKICEFEAKAENKQTIDDMIDDIAEFSEAEGFHTTRTKMERCGDFLSIDLNYGAEKGGVFLAHTDTVHEKGIFGQNPVTRLEDRIIAPGAIDCKGGIAIALLTMKALKEHGYKKHVRLLLTSDEEISNTLGGQEELDYFKHNCSEFPYAVNLETTEKDEVVISRKGILKYRLDISGIGGHSGIHYFDCKNAIVEAAHKIIALENSSILNGITYSCNIIQGGARANIIPDSCSLTVDIRVPQHADIKKAEDKLFEIAKTDFIGNTSTLVVPLSKRPPFEKNPATEKLFNKLLDTCHKYSLGSLTPVESGGGSDSCYTQMFGIPSICGMGGCGEFCHTNKEYVLIESIPLRSKILAAFLTEE